MGENDDSMLSDHTLAMRRAARFCITQELSQEMLNDIAEKLKQLPDENLPSLRQQSREEFWQGEGIEALRFQDVQSAEVFRRSFHDKNLPCLIDFEETAAGEEGHPYSELNKKWRMPLTSTNRQSYVNRQWFLDNLGPETIVPLRYQEAATNASSEILDEDGRATECQTKNVHLKDWIFMLEKSCGKDTSTKQILSNTSTGSPLYLKDWHLQLKLKNEKKPTALYQCPAIFEVDLLNSFLLNFTQGDYRFCYWGPKGSYTSRHSDVLHSYSWSYNVVGSKKWTFFDGARSSHDEKEFSIIQNAGQAMFVPSTLQHEVVNLEETISINHNWITTANIDLCWQCLVAEMAAIEKELTDWGISDPDAMESMLRGCTGLDVTTFFLMIYSQFLSLNKASLDSPYETNAMRDVKRILDMITTLHSNRSVKLLSRFIAVFQSEVLGTTLLDQVDALLHTIANRSDVT